MQLHVDEAGRGPTLADRDAVVSEGDHVVAEVRWTSSPPSR